jgi:predicted transcriptional regulator
MNKEQTILWRRGKVLELSSNGYNEREIATKLHISQPTVSRDIYYLRQQAKDAIRKYIDERVPMEFSKTLAGLEGIIKSMSDIIGNNKDNKEVINASALKMQAYDMKMELVSNASLVQEAIDLSQKHRGLIDQKDKVLKDGCQKPT